MGIFRGRLIFAVWRFFQYADFNFREFKTQSSLIPTNITFENDKLDYREK